MTFQSLGLPDKVVQALQTASFQQPAAVQVISPLACSSSRGPLCLLCDCPSWCWDTACHTRSSNVVYAKEGDAA